MKGRIRACLVGLGAARIFLAGVLRWAGSHVVIREIAGGAVPVSCRRGPSRSELSS